VKNPSIAHFFFLVTIGLATIAAFSAGAGNEAEVRQRVREFAERFAHAERAEEIAEIYASDATHINPRGEWVRGRQKLIEYFEPLVSERSERFGAELTIERVSFLSEWVALVDGSILIRDMPGTAGGEQHELLERYTFVMKRYGGTWEIAASRVMFPAGPVSR
jgi:uncharacterized protein (TIGR02246 family)